MDKKILFSLHSLNNIEITNYFNNEPRFNGFFSRNNLPKIKDRLYVINIDDKNNKGSEYTLASIIY